MNFLKAIGDFAGKLGPFITAGGGIVATIGQRQQYQAAADVASYNEAIYRRNSEIIEEASALRKGLNEKRKMEYLSSLRANYGFRGVELSGSPLLVMAESAAELELDIQLEEHNSLLDAQRARSAATLSGTEATAYKKARKTVTGTGIIQTASRFASEY